MSENLLLSDHTDFRPVEFRSSLYRLMDSFRNGYAVRNVNGYTVYIDFRSMQQYFTTLRLFVCEFLLPYFGSSRAVTVKRPCMGTDIISHAYLIRFQAVIGLHGGAQISL